MNLNSINHDGFRVPCNSYNPLAFWHRWNFDGKPAAAGRGWSVILGDSVMAVAVAAVVDNYGNLVRVPS